VYRDSGLHAQLEDGDRQLGGGSIFESMLWVLSGADTKEFICKRWKLPSAGLLCPLGFFRADPSATDPSENPSPR